MPPWIIAFASRPEVQANLLAFGLTVVLAIASRLFAPRANIIWGTSHQFAFGIPQEGGGKLPLFTRSVFVRNQGWAAAENVEIHLAYKPDHYQLWPTFPYREVVNPEGHFIITLDNFGRHEHVSIEMIQSNREPPFATRVRSKQREWPEVPILPMRVFPTWFLLLTLFAMFWGVFSALSLLIQALWRLT